VSLSKWELDDETLRFVTPWWQDEYRGLLDEFKHSFPIPADFLVRLWNYGGFFMEDINIHREELKVCQKHFDDWELLLIEQEIPHVVRHQTLRNTTTVHHLYHLARWEQETGCDVRDLDTIVEWGGGFGSMARLCMRRNPRLHYSIIDLPLMSEIQRHYLGIWDLDRRFSAYTPPEAALLQGSLFISTWALDESTAYAQGFAAAAFHYTPHWLIAQHPDKDIFPQSGNLNHVLPPDLQIVPTPFFESFYAFR
jgi:hypothetical protein